MASVTARGNPHAWIVAPGRRAVQSSIERPPRDGPGVFRLSGCSPATAEEGHAAKRKQRETRRFRDFAGGAEPESVAKRGIESRKLRRLRPEGTAGARSVVDEPIDRRSAQDRDVRLCELQRTLLDQQPGPLHVPDVQEGRLRLMSLRAEAARAWEEVQEDAMALLLLSPGWREDPGLRSTSLPRPTPAARLDSPRFKRRAGIPLAPVL